MAAVRAIIRYHFTTTKDGGQKTTALITAVIPGSTPESAQNYVTKKYPERYNIEITELSIQKS